MSNPAHLKVGGDDDLDKLLRQVSMGFLHSPISPSESMASPTFSDGWTTQRSSSLSAELVPQTPLPSDEGQSTNFRRRRLPPTPQMPPIAGTSFSIPNPPPPPPPLPVPASTPFSQPSSTSGPSQPSSFLPSPSGRLSRKISRRYPVPQPSQATYEATDDNDAGPSDSNAAPPSPSTEYPDQFENLPLPSYYDNAEIDPIAFASLGHGPRINGADYTGPPPPESASELDESSSVSFTDPEPQTEGTFISGDFPMLRPPSHSSFPGTSFHPQVDENEIVETPGWRANHVEISQRPTSINESFYFDPNDEWAPNLERRNTNVIEQIKNFVPRPLELHEEEEADLMFDEDERRFIYLSLLSHLAVQLYDNVPRGTHVKGSVRYPRAFTGKDVVSTIHSIIQRELVSDHGTSITDRRPALLVARSLQSALFFSEVEWGGSILQDGVEDVYTFLDDSERGSDGVFERTELPTGVETILTKCYSASCDGPGCYSYTCPRKGMQQLPSLADAPADTRQEEWSARIPPQVLASLKESEINRQTIIQKLTTKEKQYIEDLDIVESVFITPLRTANPPVMTPLILDEFIKEVFGNILQLRECNQQLLEQLYVRHREQGMIVQNIGDIFLTAATDFRAVYPIYIGRHPLAEKRMKEELEHNPEFRLFIEKCSRQLSARPGGPRLDLKHYLNRPAEHLQKYPVLLDAVYHETERSNPDGDYLLEAIDVIRDLQNVAQLQTFQSAMGKGSTSKWEWHNLLSHDKKQKQWFSKEESNRQSVIFELIKGEMAYVRDLENIETMYVRPLRNAEPPIIPPERLEQFLMDVFHNFSELHAHHRRLVDRLHQIQRDEHPRIRSITSAVMDAALHFREAYMEYIPNYPIAAYRIDEETANNPLFKAFVTHTVRHPDAHRLDMKSFINRPIPRLLRYELLLNEILKETPPHDEDRRNIPDVIDLIKALGRETEPGVTSSKQKVELWRCDSNLVFKNGAYVDMDLLNDQRSLIYTGKLWERSRDTWVELFVMLFDNYLVMTKPKEKDEIMKYHVHRKPFPLDLLKPINFADPVVQRSSTLLRTFRSNDRQSDTISIASREGADTRGMYPCNLHYHGRNGGPYILYAESSALRLEWKQKLEEALGLRKVVQESNKVFENETLSVDTFKIPPPTTGPNPSGSIEFFTGEVTCSVPFNTHDGRRLVAIGCAEGVWIGYRHDSQSMSRVLHLKKVTQCAVLDEFGLFLVLADKVFFAYHLEALVPTTGNVHASQTPQKINARDVHFFSIGVLHSRTLVIYMKKKGNGDSVFHAVEPVIDKINERPKPSGSLLPSLKKYKTEWFRLYKEFTFSDAHDVIFLKTRIAVLCAKGFSVVDLKLTDYESVMIPLRDDVNFSYLPKRCESCRPIGMFRSSDLEFLLCYDEFGLFVDNNGKPRRSTGIIEWEGKADRVAMHTPYILLFDSQFIEVRHIETGHLVQIIPGTGIRCVWDGRAIDGGTAVNYPDRQEDTMVQEPRIHAVMNIQEISTLPRRPGRYSIQHVFELFPTIPLYLPGSLASPSNSNYFSRPFSPPHSPSLRPHHI